MVVGIVIQSTSSSNKQEKFEEAYITELEKTIEEFKSEHQKDVQSITYSLCRDKEMCRGRVGKK